MLASRPNPLPSCLAVLALALASSLALSTDHAAASHVRCGDVITTDTTLDSDLLDCPNNGIVIGADNITLDLNGHTIAGDDKAYELCREDEPCDIGVLNDGYDAVTVKRGTTRDFGLGIVVVGAKHNRVRHVAAVGNAFEGIVIFRSTRTRIEESLASRNGVGKSRPGIALAESDHNRIMGNTMSGNGDLGLFMEASDNNLIRHNTARRNPEGGMIIEGDRNEIVRNRLVRNGGGILITIVRRGGTASGNVVSRNVVRGTRSDGISVDPVPKRTLIKGNVVVGARRAGFAIGSRSSTITGNRATRNGGLGIKAVRGVTDGGGNRASGNGDPRQCVVVACR